ncbi:13716_t:CDS:2 [Dentiscutata erythropus]|uniref:13716_t:CDS:1 n=1 Tax=Dentiscutata erythropus TaxID=1348616 RepID=A0A9N9FFL9_9GLOM|nr:13716_t:CDS:2 [Dentiscutata erythropus]
MSNKEGFPNNSSKKCFVKDANLHWAYAKFETINNLSVKILKIKTELLILYLLLKTQTYFGLY